MCSKVCLNSSGVHLYFDIPAEREYRYVGLYRDFARILAP